MKKTNLLFLSLILAVAAAHLSCSRQQPFEKPVVIALSKGSPSDTYQTYTKWLGDTEAEIVFVNLYKKGLDSALATLDRCDGLLLTGGEDIDPGWYGMADSSGLSEPPDLYRDSLEYALLGKALSLNIPVLGICRGLQMINVFMGGTLYFDLPAELPDTITHRKQGTYNCLHEVTVANGSLLHNIAGMEQGTVNSNHHQGIRQISGTLLPAALSADGLVEAVVHREPEGRSFFMGVQWHPERMDFQNPFSGKIATAFINASKKMKIISENFGNTGSENVRMFTISNDHGLVMKLLNYGGILVSLKVPDKNGKAEDIVLGFDSFEGYKKNTPYFGALIGRYANRIANGRFELDGITFSLAQNNGINSLHGGIKGFDKVIWDAVPYYDDQGNGLLLRYISKDMEEGYPGNLQVEVLYQLRHNNELYIRYIAKTDKSTPVNLTHHSYFNLGGPGREDILGHHLRINADRFTAVDSVLIPTGELKSVEGQMDFRALSAVGSRIDQVQGGYDHNYVLNKTPENMPVAELYDPLSGRVMEVFTTEPGIQFYSGNFLDGSIEGKNGIRYQKHHGLCLETQHFPDSPNQPSFPNTLLNPGEVFRSETIYRFSVR
ncbi:MAG: galactose-1-epimerase [Bacteroidales bacterium]|nr:galactose-1-epimerase [Bacteroidales bacterium]